MDRLLAELRARVLGGWRTSAAAVLLLLALGLLHLEPEALRDLAARVQALGELAGAVTSTLGTLGSVASAAALLLARGKGGE